MAHSFLEYKISLVPHTTNTVVVNLSKEYMDYVNGTGFEIVVPELSESVLIAHNDEFGGNESNGTDESGESTVNDIGVGGVGSSSGGCEAGAGVLTAILLAITLILKKAECK